MSTPNTIPSSTRYYLWVWTAGYEAQPAGSLHGYLTRDELKEEPYNKIAMGNGNWYILEGQAVEISEDMGVTTQIRLADGSWAIF